jgi:hypothetical protein
MTVQQSGRRGLSDSAQLEFAAREDWVFVAFDSDYLAIARRGVEHAGIVWTTETKYSIGLLSAR